MATIPVYLTDDNGDEIEQTSGSGDFIIVGYVNQDLFANTSGLLSTTFFDVVQAATPEEKAEVLRGLRLAKGIRGDLRRFELSGTSGNAYVKYNHSIFGGRFQSQYTALGAIAGTYLRRGGSAFTKELVEAALISGAYANFSNFPGSPVLPGAQTFQVNAGGGTVSAYAWAITDGSTTFSPTGASVTETLTAGSWAVSCDVTIDGAVISVASQSLTVSALVASAVTSSDPTPTVGESVLYGLTVNNDGLLGAVTWSVEMEVPFAAGTVFIPVDEDIHYNTVSASGRTATIQFLVGGNYRVTANYVDANGQNSASLNVASQDAAPAAVGSTTHSTNFSSALANAYRAGDVHMIVCGDSINNQFSSDRFRYGQTATWAPARWAGTSMNNGRGAATIPGTGYESDDSLTNVTANKGAGSGVASEPYINSSKLDNAIATRRTQEANYMQFESDIAVTDNTFGTSFFTSNEWMRDATGLGGNSANDYYTGRLQREEDTFYRASGAETRVAVYGLNDFTLLAKGDTAPQQNVSVTADNYSIITLDRDPSLHTEDSGAEAVVQLDFGTDTDIGDGFGLMDMMSYNSNIDGLSLSYLGNGGWNTANHSPLSETLRVTVGSNFYNDDAIENHLRMFGFKSAGVLRDNIVVCLWIQNRNNSEGHVGQMINDLDLWRGRWEAAADAVNASMKANMTFLVCTMPDIIDNNEHQEVGSAVAEIAGQTGFENVALLDLNKKLKTEGIDIDEYTGTLAGGSGTQSPLWYGSNTSTDGQDADSIHPRGSGSEAMMGFWWDVVVEEIATSPAALSFTLNTPANGTTADTFNFSASGSLPTDRLVTWYVDGTKTAHGDSFTLPSSVGTFVVRCVIDAADGGQAEQSHTTTITSASTPASLLSFAAAGGATNGDTVTFTATWSDADGDQLDWNLNVAIDGGADTFVSGDASVANNGGVNTLTIPDYTTTQSGSHVFTLTLNSSEGSDTETVTVVTQDPTATGSVTVTGAVTEGDVATIAFSIIDDDETATTDLDYLCEVSIDGGAFSNVSTNPTGKVTEPAPGVGVASATHTCATAGSYVFRMTITDGDGGELVSSSAATTVAAAPSETKVYSATATYNGVNAWDNETELTGGTYWETRTGDGTLDPFNNFVVTGSQMRWFTSQDGGGLIATAIAGDATNGTHEVRIISPGGETFVLSKTWTFSASNRADWASSGTAVGSVQGSRTGSQLLTEMRSSTVGDVWELQYWEL